MISDGLIVIGRLNYPSGSAPSNRVHLYCKALKEAKGFPFVINLHSTFTQPQTFNYLDRYEGVPFYYCQKTPLRKSKFIPRNISKIEGLISSFIVIRRLCRKYNMKVLFFSTSVFNEVTFFIFLKLMNIPIIKECNEAPLFVRQEKKSIGIDRFFLKLKTKMYGEIIVISDNLNKYYSEIFPKSNIYQIPILVDMERFSNLRNTRSDDNKEITYVGYMGGNKDGLGNLIEAMSIISQKANNARLNLVGSAPEKDILRLKSRIEALALRDVVHFLGSKTPDEIPLILANADLLVLARPNNNQAKAGFPTKLGEYLASAKPVVITRTGEIPKYLVDNRSAYLTEPDDVNGFAEKVLFALEDENAEKIGAAGYEIANRNFNYKLYGKELIQIIRKKGSKKYKQNPIQSHINRNKLV
ncbi:MAG TPA: glycosyltransferase [Flavitalea sp.]|nr:glycosyltransferase [Flavitalea sp.]